MMVIGLIGYIYCTTNKVNGKKYIGRHESTEFEPDRYIGSGTLLLRAVEKYGKDNFTCELIEECNSVAELADRERYWINFYDAVNDPRYYNLSDGGLGSSGEKCRQIITELWQDPAYRQKHIEGSTKKWQDPEYRERHRAGILRCAHSWTEEDRYHQSQVEKQSWSDADLRARHSDKMKSIWTDDKKRAHREKNLGVNNPSYGRRYMTDGCDNWLYVRPETAPEGFYVASYVFITDGIKKLRHDRSLPIPEGWAVYQSNIAK